MGKKQMEKTTIALSFLAYTGAIDTDTQKIYTMMANNLKSLEPYIGKHEIAWGPSVHENVLELFDDSLMLITQNVNKPQEFIVSVRGMNPASLSTWLFQDLWIYEQYPWKSSDAPKDAKISQGMHTGLKILANLKPDSHKNVPGHGTILDFFTEVLKKSTEKVTIVFTGHSLGATLASTLALWFQEQVAYLFCDRMPLIYVYSYAGPTAGNKEFAEYSSRVLGEHCLRYQNYLDITSYFWNKKSLSKVPYIYCPEIKANFLQWIIFKFAYVAIRDKGYMQIENSMNIKSQIDKSKKDFWAQVDFQHHDPFIKRFIELASKEGKKLDPNGTYMEIFKTPDIGTASVKVILNYIIVILKALLKLDRLWGMLKSLKPVTKMRNTHR